MFYNYPFKFMGCFKWKYRDWFGFIIPSWSWISIVYDSYNSSYFLLFKNDIGKYRFVPSFKFPKLGFDFDTIHNFFLNNTLPKGSFLSNNYSCSNIWLILRRHHESDGEKKHFRDRTAKLSWGKLFNLLVSFFCFI